MSKRILHVVWTLALLLALGGDRDWRRIWPLRAYR